VFVWKLFISVKLKECRRGKYRIYYPKRG